MLDVLADKVHPNLRLKHLATHQRLAKLTQLIEDKAAVYGQRLELLLIQWQEFNEKFDETIRWMKGLSDSKPSVPSEEDTSVELRSKMLDYRYIENALADEKSNIFALVSKGRQLFQAVTCPIVEKVLADFAETWIQFHSEIASQLKRFLFVLLILKHLWW